MSTTYTDVFTGKNITAAFPQYSAIALTSNITLSWPAQFQNLNNVVSVIMDITPSAGGFTVKMPDAREGSTGFAFTINNPGLFSFDLVTHTGTPIATIATTKAELIWLIDNSQIDGDGAGAWRNIPAFGGAGAVSSVNAASDTDNLVITGDPGLPITTGGTIEFALAKDLLALTGFDATTGFPTRTEVDTWALRSFTQTAGQVIINNANGIAGNPIFSLAPNITGVSSLALTGLTFGVGVSNLIASIGVADIVLTPGGTGEIVLSNTAKIMGGNKLKFVSAIGTNYISFRTGTTGVIQELIWPTNAAIPGQVLSNNGAGSLSWASVATSAGVSTPDAIARYSNTVGGLKDSPTFLITDLGDATGLASCEVGDIRIATLDSQTISTAGAVPDQDLVVAPVGNGSLRSKGDVRIERSGGFQRKLRLYNNIVAPGDRYAGLQADPNMAADVTWTWPAADAAGLFTSDGVGVMSITPLTSYFPAVTTPNAVARYSATGVPLKNSLFVIDDLGAATGLVSSVISTSLTVAGISMATTTITTAGLNDDLDLQGNNNGHVYVHGELNVTSKTGVQGDLRLWDLNETYYSKIISPAVLGGIVTWTLPTAPSAGLFTSDGSGVMSITPLTSYFPAVTTPNAVARYSATGVPLKNSLFVIDDLGAATGLVSSVISTSLTVASINLATNIISTTGVNQNLIVSPNGTGFFVANCHVDVTSAGTAKSLRLYEDGGGMYCALKSPAVVAANLTWTLPSADFNALMSSNGAGALTLATGLTAPGSGKIGLGTTTFEATSTNSLTFLNGTAAIAAPAANSLVLQSIPATSTVGTTLGWYGSGSGGIYMSVAIASTHKINIKINGTNYYIMATTVA